MNYEHSEVFALLKKTKDVKVNFTTYQWLATLDYLIGRALRPILLGDVELANAFFAKVLAFSQLHRSKKFTTDGKSCHILATFNLLAGNVDREKAVLDMHLNRGVILALLASYKDVVKADLEPHKLSEVKNRQYKLQFSNPNAFCISRESEFWHKKALKFRELILAKYTRLTIMQAKILYSEINHTIPLDDIVQTFIVCLARAVDRCDCDKGVLTTFITNWLKSARSDILRSVTELSRHKPIEVLENIPASTSLDIESICELAKRLDPEGLTRYHLGIPEFLTQAQYQVLNNCK